MCAMEPHVRGAFLVDAGAVRSATAGSLGGGRIGAGREGVCVRTRVRSLYIYDTDWEDKWTGIPHDGCLMWTNRQRISLLILD